MSALLSPRLGFQVPSSENSVYDSKLAYRMSRTGIAAARRKFMPEFINRLDKLVVFKSMGQKELRRMVDIELEMVPQRIQTAAAGKPFMVNVTASARDVLVIKGTDFRYGARPLKRAIEQLLVQPISNLMATGQIDRGDCIRVTQSEGSPFATLFQDRGAFEERAVAGRVAA